MNRYIGRTDDPLSPEGEAALCLLPRDNDARLVYVTPLKRTQQTAAILFPHAKQRVVPDLREMDFGDFENRSAEDMASDAAYRAWVEQKCLPACPGGESVEQFRDRVCAAFVSVLAEERTSGGNRPAFVLHGGTIMALMYRFSAHGGDYYQWCVNNGRGYQAEVTPQPDGPATPFLMTHIVPVTGTRPAQSGQGLE